MNYSQKTNRFKTRRNFVIISILLLVVLLASAAVLIRKAYNDNLNPLNASDTSEIIVTIEPGSVTSEIAQSLKTRGIIKSDWAFEWYVRNNSFRDDLKAGTYLFMPSQSVQQIVEQIIDADVTSDLVTILPGKRLDEIKQDLVEAGFSSAEVEQALDSSAYRAHPALTGLPQGSNLEGYLYPESFQKVDETTAKEVVTQSLDEMQRYLTPEIRNAFSAHGLSVHQGVTIASIVEQEVSREDDRPIVAQVFLKRYKEGIRLGADPTAFYGAIINDNEPTVFYDSPYNTRLYAGLPPGPIGNVSVSSLEAVAFPAQTDWIFFVAGDDGTTHFSKTLSEHEALTEKYCTKLCN